MSEIFLLINKMTATERRQFPLFAQKHRSNPPDLNNPESLPAENSVDFDKKTGFALKKYLLLFKAYVGLGEKSVAISAIEEKKIQKELNSSDEQFNFLKSYLSGLVFDFLRHNQRESVFEIRLNNLILDAKILEDRGLLDWSLKKLNKAYEEAFKFEFFYLAAEATSRIIQILNRRGNVKMEDLDRHFNNLEQLRQHEISEMMYRRDNYFLYLKFQKTGVARNQETLEPINEFETKIAQRTVLAPPLNFNATVAYYSVRTQIATIKGDSKGCYEYSKAVVAAIEQYPHFIDFKPLLVFAYMGKFLGYCILNHFLEEAAEVIQKIEKIPYKTINEKAMRIVVLDLNIFLFLMNSNRLKEAEIAGEKLEINLEKYKKYIPLSQKINFKMNQLILFLVMENFKMAQIKLTEYLKLIPPGKRGDLQIALRMLHLLLYYEIGDTDSILYSHDTLVRRLRSLKFEMVFERKTIETVYNLINVDSERNKKNILHNFLTYLQEAKKGKGLDIPAGFALIEIWATSRHDGVTMAKVYQNTLAQANFEE